jgi:hypothetical protein
MQNRFLRAVVLPGLRPVLVGLILGSAGGLGLSWLVHTTLVFPESSDFFYDVPFYDPVTFLGLFCFVVAVAAIASLVAARRALRGFPWLHCEKSEEQERGRLQIEEDFLGANNRRLGVPNPNSELTIGDWEFRIRTRS